MIKNKFNLHMRKYLQFVGIHSAKLADNRKYMSTAIQTSI